MRPVFASAIAPVFALALAFGIAGCDRNNAPQPQPKAEASAGPAAKVDRTHKGEEAPAVPFTGPDGGPATLASFRGKPLIVNLWATWCAPCVVEMPQLDAIAAGAGGRFELIAVSQDMAGKKEVDPFFAEHKFKALRPYLDKQNVLMEALKAETLPVTIMYDAKGKEIWRVVGKFDWAGAEAKALVEEGA
ncbi:TlpA family protein disulfide reductase [Sphingomonas sp. ID0503]|uniref:TlpA family protein disulfide reductase n=1 Tax=Sphingomonas sp. ID0503 TaxID=3399691 RepID=UPI003AFA5183